MITAKLSELQLRCNGKYFDAMAAMKANNDVRYYLNGVYAEPVEAGGVLLVATDGYRLSAVRDEYGYCSEPLIVESNTPLLQAARKSHRQVVMVNDQLVVASVVHGVTQTAESDDTIGVVAEAIYPGDPKIDGKYPDFRRVLPSEESLTRGLKPTVNFGLLMSFAQQAGKMGLNSKSVSFYYQSESPNGAIIIRLNDCPEYIGALMPMKNDDAEWPTWLKSE